MTDDSLIVNNAICYVTDSDFLITSLASIFSIKTNSNSYVKTFLLCVDFDKMSLEKAELHSELLGYEMILVDSRDFGSFSHHAFDKSHISFSALGRFFLSRYLPGYVDRIIYIDGDTFINRSIDDILSFRLPEGRFLASESSLFYGLFGSRRKVTSEYFKGLNISVRNGYFNSGVIISSLALWRDIEAEAFEFFVKYPERCRYHDQSALNAISKGRRLRMSISWNFESPYAGWGFDRFINPSIIHFTGPHKPWKGYNLYKKSEVVKFMHFYSKFSDTKQIFDPYDTIQTEQNRIENIKKRLQTRDIPNNLARFALLAVLESFCVI